MISVFLLQMKISSRSSPDQIKGRSRFQMACSAGLFALGKFESALTDVQSAIACEWQNQVASVSDEQNIRV